MEYTPPHKKLLDSNYITEEQHNKLDLIHSSKLISLFYELRILLYLGVMLLSTGVGILVYENIGSLGHIISLIFISLLCITCFVYSFFKQAAYSNEKLAAPNPYFDYILLLGCLLFISVFGYLQFLYGVLDNNLEWLTLLTAFFFFFIAYRLDHLAVLSLAITAIASYCGLSITPQKWYDTNFFDSNNLYVIAIIFSLSLVSLALLLDWKGIKKHFTFSYINISSLVFFIGTNTGLFSSNNEWLYLALQLMGTAGIIYFSTRAKSFLFLIYGFVFGYIAFTYLIITLIPNDLEILWAYYLLFSCGLFVFLIIKYRNIFKRGE